VRPAHIKGEDGSCRQGKASYCRILVGMLVNSNKADSRPSGPVGPFEAAALTGSGVPAITYRAGRNRTGGPAEGRVDGIARGRACKKPSGTPLRAVVGVGGPWHRPDLIHLLRLVAAGDAATPAGGRGRIDH
jgi:hypothetical protein